MSNVQSVALIIAKMWLAGLEPRLLPNSKLKALLTQNFSKEGLSHLLVLIRCLMM